MAYSDYGAFVYKNGERRYDKENVALFATDEETFGTDSTNVPSGTRIWISLMKAKEYGEKENAWVTQHIHHGILGDGNIRVMCHKQGLPEIFELTENGIEEIKYHDDTVDYFDYDPFGFDYKGYHFTFTSGYNSGHYFVTMDEPDGTTWECEYDYGYGAGFEEEG